MFGWHDPDWLGLAPVRPDCCWLFLLWDKARCMACHTRTQHVPTCLRLATCDHAHMPSMLQLQTYLQWNSSCSAEAHAHMVMHSTQKGSSHYARMPIATRAWKALFRLQPCTRQALKVNLQGLTLLHDASCTTCLTHACTALPCECKMQVEAVPQLVVQQLLIRK